MLPRTGIGYDIHHFLKGRKLFLGGVEIPHPVGLAGHSDADVVLHAICDAILGAAGKGDIGEYFSPQDKRWEGISSLVLLKQVYDLVKKDGYSVGNVDVVIQAEEPKITPYKTKMRAAIAKELAVESDRINIKATTQEGMDAIGQKKAIAAFASVLLFKE